MSLREPIAAALARATEGIRLLSPEEVEVERIETARSEIARRARSFRAQLEPQLSPEEFGRLVHPRLRALSERYEPARGSVLVIGPAGVGKTLAVRRLARRMLARAWREGAVDSPIVGACWFTALDLATALRETKFGATCDPMRAAQRAPLLFLDELGQENADPRWLLEVTDARYSARLATLATSGLEHRDLVARYGTGAVRRLTEPNGTLLDLHEGTL